MRNSSLIHSRIWLGGTGHKILHKLGDSEMVIAIYLMTSPHSHMSGIYYCPMAFIATETNHSTEEVEQFLAGLEEVGLIQYDREHSIVWVIKMAKHQLKGMGNKNDNNFRGVLNHLRALPETSLVDAFVRFYKIEAYIEEGGGGGFQGASKGLPRGFEGASKGLPRVSEEAPSLPVPSSSPPLIEGGDVIPSEITKEGDA